MAYKYRGQIPIMQIAFLLEPARLIASAFLSDKMSLQRSSPLAAPFVIITRGTQEYPFPYLSPR